MTEFLCLNCREVGLRPGAPPPGGTLDCPGCGYRYPLPLEGLPVIVPDPRAYAAAAFRALHATSSHGRHVADAYDAAPAGRRTDVLAELAAALRANSEILDEIQTLLRPYVDPTDLLTSSGHEAGLFDVWGYLRRDWSGMPESEGEVGTNLESVARGLEAATAPPERALLLGAGAGRLAHDLRTRFADVVSLDLTFAMGALLHRIERAGVEMYSVYAGNHRRAADEADHLRLRAPDPPAAAGGHTIVVADARAVPLADGTVSAVVANYFTDLLPLSAFLPEVHRVLCPGGVFVHFGPLGHSHAAEHEKYAADEFGEVVAEGGFEVAVNEFVRTTHLADGRLMSTPTFDCLLLAAVRT